MDQIRTKAIFNVSREGSSSFESCSTWEGANDLPWERKGLPGRQKGEIMQINYKLHHVSQNAALPQVFFYHILRTVPKDFPL